MRGREKSVCKYFLHAPNNVTVLPKHYLKFCTWTFASGSHEVKDCRPEKQDLAWSGWLAKKQSVLFIQVTSKICLELSDFTDNTKWLPGIGAIRGLLASLLCPQIPLMAMPGVHGHCRSGSELLALQQTCSQALQPWVTADQPGTCVWC